jgi:hypothetical protein
MKKLILLSLAVPVALLLSFTLRQDGIKKIGTNLYSVSKESSNSISAADKEELKKIIMDHYHLKDTKEDIVINNNNPINHSSNWILSTSLWTGWVSTKFISWDDKAILTKDAQRAKDIISKYASK